ncbi:hypothetical protein ACFLX5_03455 [Chloroflexota bacterium]
MAGVAGVAAGGEVTLTPSAVSTPGCRAGGGLKAWVDIPHHLPCPTA